MAIRRKPLSARVISTLRAKAKNRKNIIKDLTPRQQKTMRSHARHHTLKHMRSMARLMSGASGRKRTFAQAHTIAMRRVGK